MNRLVVILFVAIVASGCNYSGIKVKGNWNIQSYEGNFDVIVRRLELNDDYTCELPLTDLKHRNTSLTKGTWDSYNKEDKVILVINSDNKLFEGEYEMSNWRRELAESDAYWIKATFSKDDIVLNCAKAAD